jgi:hypothetical protein
MELTMFSRFKRALGAMAVVAAVGAAPLWGTSAASASPTFTCPSTDPARVAYMYTSVYAANYVDTTIIYETENGSLFGSQSVAAGYLACKYAGTLHINNDFPLGVDSYSDCQWWVGYNMRTGERFPSFFDYNNLGGQCRDVVYTAFRRGG